MVVLTTDVIVTLVVLAVVIILALLILLVGGHATILGRNPLSPLSVRRSAACAESVINAPDGHVGQPIYAKKRRKNEV